VAGVAPTAGRQKQAGLTAFKRRSKHGEEMTTDERIEALLASQAKTQTILADVLDSIKRLERIALSHEVRLQDTEATLAALEGKARPKPQ
jgi:DNA-binding TFAR19-related protein (PDSD5 family)